MLGISGWWRSGCGRCLHSESWKPVLRETGRGKVWPKFACFFLKGKIPAPSLGHGKVSLHQAQEGLEAGEELCFTPGAISCSQGRLSAILRGLLPGHLSMQSRWRTKWGHQLWKKGLEVILQAVWQRLRKQEGVLASSHRGIPEMGMSPEKAGKARVGIQGRMHMCSSGAISGASRVCSRGQFWLRSLNARTTSYPAL